MASNCRHGFYILARCSGSTRRGFPVLGLVGVVLGLVHHCWCFWCCSWACGVGVVGGAHVGHVVDVAGVAIVVFVCLGWLVVPALVCAHSFMSHSHIFLRSG